jgi:hypothetical protein
LYIIFNPVKTDEVSSVAAPCAFNVVEGDDVEIGRLCGGSGLLDLAGMVCFELAAGEREAFGGLVVPGSVSLC